MGMKGKRSHDKWINTLILYVFMYEALQILPSLQAELEEAWQSQQELQEMATYMALMNSNRNPLAKALLKQAADKMKSVKSLVSLQ